MFAVDLAEVVSVEIVLGEGEHDHEGNDSDDAGPLDERISGRKSKNERSDQDDTGENSGENVDVSGDCPPHDGDRGKSKNRNKGHNSDDH